MWPFELAHFHETYLYRDAASRAMGVKLFRMEIPPGTSPLCPELPRSRICLEAIHREEIIVPS